MRRILLLLLSFAAIFIVYAAWKQHPYRGGVKRFEYFFGVGFPNSFEMVSLPLNKGSYRDDPRFRFQLHDEQFEQLTKILQNAGYSEWKNEGGAYGSFNEESRPDDPLLVSNKYCNRWKFMFFYRPSTGILDAVTFFN